MRELVLTGTAGLWPADERDALFLGPWCFAHHARHAYADHERFSLAPSPDPSADRICRDAHHVAALCERLLPSLAAWLNELHGVRHTPRFWRVITINWLVHWVGACWDRYQRFHLLGDAIADPAVLAVKIIGPDRVRCETTQGFIAQLADPAYNLQLMSDLLRATDGFAFLKRVDSDLGAVGPASSGSGCGCPIPHPWKGRGTHAGGRSGSAHVGRCTGAARAEACGPSARAGAIRQLGASVGDAIAAWALPRMRAVCHLGHIYGVDRLDKLRILVAVNPADCFRLSRRPRRAHPIVCERSRSLARPLSFDGRDDFERVLCEMLPLHLPRSFLSYYPSESRRVGSGHVRVGSGTHEPLDRLYEIAHFVEAGGRWVSVQHGGGYGQTRCLGVEAVEYETPGEFVTWGWSGEADSTVRFHPLPSPQLSKLHRHRGRGDRLVFAGTMVPAYHYRFHSVLQPEGIVAYLRGKERFLGLLSDAARGRLLYRPYMHDYGVGEVGWVRRAAPGCEILDGGTLVEGLSRARLAVFDHMATGFLEALVMGVPLVLYWDPAVFVVGPRARPYFDALRSCGILHDTPEGAAGRVNEVWDEPSGWWRDGSVRAGRDAFCREFALTSTHWRRRWAAFLRGCRR